MEVIDSIKHYYTGKQILSHCFRVWERSGTELGVVLLTHRGEAADKIKAARVALSKERKKQGVGGYYGFVISEIFPWTHSSGYKGEAVLIRYSQRKYQQLAYVFDTQVIGKHKERNRSNG